MKKKLLALLLTIAVILTSTVTVFAEGSKFTITNGTPESAKETNHGYIDIDKVTATEGETVTVTVNPAEGYQLKSLTATPVAPTISTIADVLATVEGFPEDTSGGKSPVTPSGAWSNGNGGFAFIYGRGNALVLCKDSYTYGFLTTPVTKKENCYTATISFGSLTFNMENGILTSFEFAADPSKPNAANYVGTYSPASGAPSARFKPITPEKQTDGTYQFKMPAANVTVTAEFEEVPVTIAVAQICDVTYPTLSDALAAASKYDIVKLLIDLDTTENINVSDSTILDLNNHTINTTGAITNSGVIVLYNKNASVIDYLLYNVPSSYGAGEELKLPDSTNPKYIVPADTFVSSDVDANGNQSLGFAIGDEYLVWNENVKKGTQLEVTYSLALGGDIIAPDDDSAQTYVEVTNLKLNKDITIGSNEDGAGTADLSVLSIIDEDPDYSVTGSITADSYMINLNKTGSLTVSDNISFDESVVVSGVDGMVISKDYDSENGICIYTVKNEHHYTNNPFTVVEGYDKDFKFVTDAENWEEKDVTIKVDGKVLDSTKYDLAHGSLHVTLHGDYIKTLVAGKHTLTTEVTGYTTINQDFYIKAKPSPNPGYVIPNTGVEGTYSNNHSLLKLSSLSLLAIGTYIVIKKKKDN